MGSHRQRTESMERPFGRSPARRRSRPASARPWVRFLASLTAMALLAAACTGDETDPEDAGAAIGVSTTDPSGGTDDETDEDATAGADGGGQADVALAARPGPFQLSIDALPDGIGRAAEVSVRGPGGEILGQAAFGDDGTAIVRDLPDGEAEVVIEDGGNELSAGLWTIPGEEPPADFDPAATDLQTGYNYITTRDGTTLSTFISLPGSATDGPYPTLVEYSGYEPSNPTAAADPYRLLVPALGFALVQVNVRGTGCSGGSFDAFERIQSLDGYDVIETVAAQPWAGKVGMFGVSYPGIMQLHVASTRPPSLAAIAPLSVIDRVESVLYPGGIYNDGFGETWTRQVGERAEEDGQSWATDRIARGDQSCETNQRFRTHNPDLVEVIQESPFATELSTERSTEPWADRIDVPVFVAGAWQDEQTGPRFPALFDELSDNRGFRAVLYNGLHADAVGPETLVELIAFYNLYVGDRAPGLDPITAVLIQVGLATIFGGSVEIPTGRYAGLDFEAGIERFESDPPIRVLFEQGGDAPNLPIPTFDARFSQWPPAETEATVFHLNGSSGSAALTAEPPVTPATFGFTTDPAEGQLTTTTDLDTIWSTEPGWSWPTPAVGSAVIADTEPFEGDVVMVGNLSADLWVSLPEATDADLEVTISEIAPDGSETYVQSGWLRLSRRALAADATERRPILSLLEEDVAPLTPGEPVEARVEVMPFAHVFHAGSRLRLSIDTPGGSKPQWRFDVSPEPTDVVIHTDPDRPSLIVAPVVSGVAVPTDQPACGSLRGQPCRAG